MPPAPQTIISSSINPANLLELQVLTNITSQLQSQGDIQNSIPYLAKIVQIVESQRLGEKPTEPEKRQGYYKQFNELRKIKAEAYAHLADAYFKTQQFVQCESSLLISVKIWEKLVQHEPEEAEHSNKQLQIAYKQLYACYKAMGKTQLAEHIQTKLSRLFDTKNKLHKNI
ncbi:uncharacterized protein B0P05DRAFT_522811 [Gilbertella persicaria]|uniref:uncharacterized protein n=1 Tax=Gilbertella persicaria TaxID=101096 RepID=UPI00221F39C9|nr:uncharacterized protein B0P05DRAFT_522811 [Gilbertella persicaria]KAI8097977.1 hypothetical protein B0P05DRAFT_522811 [Gilbertella persicaria]